MFTATKILLTTTFLLTSTTLGANYSASAQQCLGCGESAYGPNDEFWINDTYRQRQIESDQPVLNPVLPPETIYQPIDPNSRQYQENPYNYQDNPNYQPSQPQLVCYTNAYGQYECRSF